MGLDISLYHHTQPLDKIAADEAEVEAFSNKAWDFGGRKYEELTEDETEAARKACDEFSVRMGFVSASYGSFRHPGETAVEAGPSARWPDHICKRDYLRSSYNASGLNACAQRLGVPGLYEIFGRPDTNDGPYRFSPDWAASRARAVQALAAYRAVADGLDCFEVRAGFAPPSLPPAKGRDQEAAVIRLARTELARKFELSDFTAWESADGIFDTEGMNVVAIVKAPPGFLGTGIFIVTKRTLTPETDWCAQAYEIAIEMCDFVLAQPDPQNHLLHWSA